MSEHIRIKGKVIYDHLPYEDEHSFTWCVYCKKQLKEATVEFHNGAISNWLSVVCPGCKKTLWTSKVKMQRDKENKKCAICKKPTSHFNSVCVSYKLNQKTKKFVKSHLCSVKCYKKYGEDD